MKQREDSFHLSAKLKPSISVLREKGFLTVLSCQKGYEQAYNVTGAKHIEKGVTVPRSKGLCAFINKLQLRKLKQKTDNNDLKLFQN